MRPGPTHLLLLEDSSADARWLEQALSVSQPHGALSEQRFSWTLVGTLAACLRRAGEGGVDLALLDLMLPDCEGLTTFRRFHAMFPHLPVIVMTGVQDDAVALEALREGAQDYLVKGEVTPSLLTRAIRYATERQSIMEALRQSEQRFRSLIETSPDAIVMTDLEPKIILCNRQAAVMGGYERPEELLGRGAFDLIAPEDHEAAMEGMKLALDTGVVRNRQYSLLRKDGSRYTGELDASLARDGQGRPWAFTAVIKDITERHRIEEALTKAHDQLKQAHEQLEKRVQERTAELSRLNRDQETLLYVISHDLKEPLRAIENFSRLTFDRYAPQLDEKGKDFLRRVVRAAERLRELLGDVLLLSRVRRMELPEEEVEGRAVVDEALGRLEARIRQTRATVRIKGDLPKLRVEKTWAVEALYNLVDNALKFTSNGNPPDVEIAGYRGEDGNGRASGLAIRDRGPGVPPEQAERVFELFQRGVGRDVEGTGAGLAIVREIAHRHGGAVFVRPRAGGGSEFVVTFGTAAGEGADGREGETT